MLNALCISQLKWIILKETLTKKDMELFPNLGNIYFLLWGQKPNHSLDLPVMLPSPLLSWRPCSPAQSCYSTFLHFRLSWMQKCWGPRIPHYCGQFSWWQAGFITDSRQEGRVGIQSSGTLHCEQRPFNVCGKPCWRALGWDRGLQRCMWPPPKMRTKIMFLLLAYSQYTSCISCKLKKWFFQ